MIGLLSARVSRLGCRWGSRLQNGATRQTLSLRRACSDFPGLVGGKNPTDREMKQENDKTSSLLGEHQASKRITKERFMFTDAQRKKIKEMASQEFKKYLGRFKFLHVPEESELLNCVKALLALNDVNEIDQANELPGMLDATIDQIFHIKNLEVVLSIFELILYQKVAISQESVYQMTAVLISWGTKIDIRQKLAILALIPKDQYATYKELFKNYEPQFMSYYAQDVERKSVPELLNMIEVMNIYRRVGYEDIGFLENLEDTLFDATSSLPPMVLARYLIYAVQTQDIDFDRREKMLKRLDDELIVRARHLSSTDAIELLLQLVKGNVGSKLSYRLLLHKIGEDVELLSAEKLIMVINLMPAIKWKVSEKKLIYIKVQSTILHRLPKIEKDLLFETLFVCAENGVGSKEFFREALKKATKMVYLLSFSQIGKLVWINLRTIQDKDLQLKVLERLKEVDLKDEELVTLNIKDFCYLIWTLGSSPDKLKFSEVFDAFESLIRVKSTLTLQQVSYILWAVTLKYRFNVTTLEKLMRVIRSELSTFYQDTETQEGAGISKLDTSEAYFKQFTKALSDPKKEETLEKLSSWELMNIIWGLSRIDSSDKIVEQVRQLSPLVRHKLEEFSPMELMMLFRVYSEYDYLSARTSKKTPTSDEQKDKTLTNSTTSSTSTTTTKPLENTPPDNAIFIQFYKPLIDQLVQLSEGLEEDHHLIIMYELVNKPWLRGSNNDEVLNGWLKQVYRIREDKKKRIRKEEEPDEVEEDLDFQKISVKPTANQQ